MLAAASSAASALAQTVYQYRDDDGVLVFTDRKPDARRSFETRELSAGRERAEVQLSSGPHLHFVVQRNADGRLESLPVEFEGAGGAAIEIRQGDRPVAY